MKDYTDHYSDSVIDYWAVNLPEIANHCSIKEQDAVKCERDVDDMKKAEYMESHIGEEYVGVISGVQEFGLFVELDNTVEGLVRIEDMPNGKYTYVPDAMCFVRGGSQERYGFGDLVMVRVIGASKENSTVDFSIIKKVDKEIKQNESGKRLSKKR